MTAIRSQLTIAALLALIGCCRAEQPVRLACDDLAESQQEGMQLIRFSDRGVEPCDCADQPCHGVSLDPGRPSKPKRTMPGDVNRGDCPPYRYRMSDCVRAGNPHSVHCLAKCATNSKYGGSYVGGGAAFCGGQCRKASEGTWGLDYNGLFGHANVWLKYTRGRKQGGEGAYATDGQPELVSRVKHFFDAH